MSDADVKTSGQKTIQRRTVLGLGATIAGGAFIASRSRGWRNSESEDAPEGQPGEAQPSGDTAPLVIAEIEETVTDDGFDIHIGPVHVVAPAGVAEEGTPLQVTLNEVTLQLPDDNYSVGIGHEIQIVLGDHIQPGKPITIEMDLGDWSDKIANISEEAPLLMISDSESVDHPVYEVVTWNAQTQTASAVTEHLSRFAIFQFDLNSWITDRMYDLMGLSFPTPSCAYVPQEIGGATFAFQESGNTATWPCIKPDGDQILVELHSNSIMPWAVRTAPSVHGSASGDFLSIGPHLAGVYRAYHGVLGKELTLLMPGNTLTFAFARSNPPMQFGLSMSAGLFGVSILLWVVRSALDFLFRGRSAIVDELLDGFESLTCLVDLIRTTNDITDNLRFNSFIGTAMTCIQLFIAEGAQKLGRITFKAVMTIVGILASGAGLIAGAIYGILATVIGKDTFVLSVTADGSPAAADSNHESAFAIGAVPMPGVNAARTGEMPGPAPRFNAPVGILWEHRVRSSHVHTPVFDGHTVYASSYPSAIQAINADTGAQIWRQTFDGNVGSSPAVMNGTVYVCINNAHHSNRTSRVQALDAATGAELWNYHPGQEVEFSPCVADGKVFVTSRWHLITALDATTGDLIWQNDTRGQFGAAASVANGTVFAGGTGEGIDPEGVIWAFDAETGSVTWQQWGRRWLAGTPVIRNGLVYLSCGDGFLYALDTGTGDERWRFQDWGAVRYTSPAVNDRYVITPGRHGELFALDALTGAQLWVAESQDYFNNATPVIADDLVFVPHGDQLVALDIHTGGDMWKHAIDSPRPPAIINERIFVPGRDTLFAIGNVPSSSTVPNPSIAMSTNTPGRRLT